ncbi:CsgG/HfaB family protein (plasmid) [Pseudoalteromonas xiamenensis]|uniref:CsgG/HfaB family protein n=1 Tax=Pseudoalteromonas xiamenensis TaxID=882626 RepID=UPI0027E4355C|nr:CsgG/HfaB family protein [Pseudoalteromonas xiamenensis]WMN61575.1 CsgG/HfaB family protein [Pseudoalteromonas xiamenensis]
MKKVILLSAVAVTLTGCNVTQSVMSTLQDLGEVVSSAFTSPPLPIEYMSPAKQQQMNDVRKLAVTDVSGNQGRSVEREMSDSVESLYTNTVVEGQNYFVMIDRSTIDRVIKEQRFSTSDLADAKTSAKLGKLLGADAIVTASYALSDETQHYSETRSKCSDKKCKNQYEYSVSCSTKQVHARLTPKVVSVESGRIVFNKSYSGNAESSRCNDDNEPHKTKEELRQSAVQVAFAELRKDIAPHRVVVSPDLMESDNSKMPKEAKAKLDKGIEFAEAKWYDEACQMFADAQSMYSDSLALLYNNGLCAERNGELDVAKAFYKKAMMLDIDPKDLEETRTAIRRVDERNQFDVALAELKESGRL